MILASKSPRRKEILEDIGFNLKIEGAEIEEISDETELTLKIMDIARKKTFSIAEKYPTEYVVGADTIVEVDGEIIGKPKNREEAFKTLKLLSGRKHNVITAYSFINISKNIDITNYNISEVFFRELDKNMIKWYIETGEPMDKAGSYGIQGKGAAFVKKINGDFFSVMGFPIGDFIAKLNEVGIGLEEIKNI